MVPLWEAAKKTVDGGISELKDIIEKRKNMEGKEEETLKLEVVEKDLQVLSMVRKIIEINEPGGDVVHIYIYFNKIFSEICYAYPEYY